MSAYSAAIPVACNTVTRNVNSLPICKCSPAASSTASCTSDETLESPRPESASSSSNSYYSKNNNIFVYIYRDTTEKNEYYKNNKTVDTIDSKIWYIFIYAQYLTFNFVVTSFDVTFIFFVSQRSIFWFGQLIFIKNNFSRLFNSIIKINAFLVL